MCSHVCVCVCVFSVVGVCVCVCMDVSAGSCIHETCMCYAHMMQIGYRLVVGWFSDIGCYYDTMELVQPHPAQASMNPSYQERGFCTPDDFLESIHAHMDPSAELEYVQGLRRYCELFPQRSTMSMYSGCEVRRHFDIAISRFAKQRYELSFVMLDGPSAEIDELKQDFQRQMFAKLQLSSDAKAFLGDDFIDVADATKSTVRWLGDQNFLGIQMVSIMAVVLCVDSCWLVCHIYIHICVYVSIAVRSCPPTALEDHRAWST